MSSHQSQKPTKKSRSQSKSQSQSGSSSKSLSKSKLISILHFSPQITVMIALLFLSFYFVSDILMLIFLIQFYRHHETAKFAYKANNVLAITNIILSIFGIIKFIVLYQQIQPVSRNNLQISLGVYSVVNLPVYIIYLIMARYFHKSITKPSVIFLGLLLYANILLKAILQFRVMYQK